jgi:dynein heavy chain 1
MNLDDGSAKIRRKCVDSIKSMFDDSESPSFMTRCIELAQTKQHVMEFTRIRVLEALFALLRKGLSNVIDYNENHSDFPLEDGQVATYM